MYHHAVLFLLWSLCPFAFSFLFFGATFWGCVLWLAVYLYTCGKLRQNAAPPFAHAAAGLIQTVGSQTQRSAAPLSVTMNADLPVR